MNAFSHIAFSCHDIAAQEEFYTRHFGFKRSRTLKKGEPNEFFLLKLGSMRLEFFPTDRDKTVGMRGGEQTIGFRHVAFDVPKLEPVLQALRDDGIEPDPIIDAGNVIPGCRICFFRDPEGNIVELMEGYHDGE